MNGLVEWQFDEGAPRAGLFRAEASLKLAESAVDQILAALHGVMPASTVNRAAWERSTSRRPNCKSAVRTIALS